MDKPKTKRVAETRPRRQKQCVEWEITNKHNEHTVRHITTKQQGCYRPQRAVFKDFARPFTPFYCWTTATIRRWQSTRKLLSAAITLLLTQQCTIWNNLTPNVSFILIAHVTNDSHCDRNGSVSSPYVVIHNAEKCSKEVGHFQGLSRT